MAEFWRGTGLEGESLQERRGCSKAAHSLRPGLSVAFLRHSTYSKGVIHRIVTSRQAAMLQEEREGRHRA